MDLRGTFVATSAVNKLSNRKTDGMYEIGKKINFVHATKMKKKLMYQTLKVGKLYSSKLKITQNKICINKQQDQFKVSEI